MLNNTTTKPMERPDDFEKAIGKLWRCTVITMILFIIFLIYKTYEK